MIVNRLIPIILLANVFCIQISPHAHAAGGEKFAMAGMNASQAQSFLSLLKHRTASGDCRQLLPLVQLPIRAIVAHQRRIISKKKTFYHYCEQIFNKKVRLAIGQQQFDTLFVNYQGVMIGRGEVWFGLVVNKSGQKVIRVIAINNGGTKG